MQLTGLYVLRPDVLDAIYGPEERERIAKHVQLTAEPMSAGQLAEDPTQLAGVDVLLSGWGGPKLDADLLAHADRLKAFFYGAGTVKDIMTDAAWERGFLVTSAYAANAVPVAEFTVAQVVLCLKRVWQMAAATRRGEWKPLPVAGGYRSTVALLSLGAIGRLVAEKLNALLDVRVIAHDPFVDEATAKRLGVELVPIDELFATADVVSVHTPWLPETVGLVSDTLLRQMKPDASFINTARGAVVDESALIGVLRERPEMLAVLDVTYPEPPAADSPLWTLPNLVLTPHIAGSKGPECRRMGAYTAEEVERFATGRPPRYALTQALAARMA